MNDVDPKDQSRGFRDLHAWQHARKACSSVYELTADFPELERFGLTSQIRRSAVSIPSNIAEGYGRESNADFLKYLRIARGSLFELQTQLIIASDLGYIDEVQTDTAELKQQLETLSQVLAGLIRSLKQISEP